MSKTADSNKKPQKLIDELLDKYGAVKKWPVLCQAEAVLCTLSALNGQTGIEGMWISELCEICQCLADLPNSGITRTFYETHEDHRCEDEWSDWVYQCGEYSIQIHNYLGYSRNNFGDVDWYLTIH